MISILLVDQFLENARSIRTLLSSAPNTFDVKSANGYHEIMEGFHNRTSDVCLIDSEMEKGLKLLAQARSLGYTAPIVLVTANDAHETIKAMHHGMSDCLIRDDLSAAGIEHSVCWVVEQARNSSLHKQRERRYLALLDNASAIIYTHDLEGNFTSMNCTGQHLLGYSESEILEMNVSQLVSPAYRILVRKQIGQTLDAQTQTGEEVELVTRFGDHLMVEINAHPINHDGKTLEIQGIATTPAGLPQDLPWESRNFIEDGQLDVIRETNGAPLPSRSNRSANIFLSQKESRRSDRSLFIF
jgi:PAS domain S-box-containing protein